MKRAFFPAGFLLGLLLLSPVATRADGRLLTNIRYWKAPDYVRVVVDLSGPAPYTHRVLADPDRIAVDIKDTGFRSATRKIAVDDPLLTAIRMNALGNGAAQVVLDLSRPARYHLFRLSPVAGKPHRVVIDVFRDRAEAAEPAPSGGVRRVIIDAGHGGEDPGAVGLFGLKEKEITLDIARRLARKMNALPGYEAVLTRDGDYFISLRGRTEIARRRKGDLFISLHANSARSARARGFEVFFLSLGGATDKLARELADKENAADMIGGVPPGAEEEVISILFDYLQEEGMRKSEMLAEDVYNTFRDDSDFDLRNVKQAGFAVLKSMEIPAILVELGFLSNRTDAGNLRKEAFREKIAGLLSRGVEAYFEREDPERTRFHTVREGETAWSIARRYRVDVNALLTRNNLAPGSVLPVGKRLRIR
ncbi:MAG: N-acetylmuramoyl-L-alanine amidase [Candidatus Eisenbacteria bacterium]|nr:N-acetylmuramoyl-L-alanine amidase [Candidatus Eisenbacteria bacterium]